MLVRFIKNHTPYMAGETALFPAPQAAALIAKRVAVAVDAAPQDDTTEQGNATGEVVPEVADEPEPPQATEDQPKPTEVSAAGRVGAPRRAKTAQE